MTTLAHEGWTPVTPAQTYGEYTWQMFADIERPSFADVVPKPWPVDADYLNVFIEAVDRAGHSMGNGTYGLREESEPLYYSLSSKEGFPRFAEVRFIEDLAGVTVETDRRTIAIEAADIEPHYGMRFWAMPLEDGENLVAVTSRGIRLEHVDTSGIPAETGYYPLPN